MKDRLFEVIKCLLLAITLCGLANFASTEFAKNLISFSAILWFANAVAEFIIGVFHDK